MSQAALVETGIGWMSGPEADAIAIRFRGSGCSVMAIDGFMGSGKSPLGSMMEARLGTACIRVDSYLPLTAPSDVPSYVERLALSKLQEDIRSRLQSGPALLEGVLMRELLSRLSGILSSSLFHVYVAGAWQPDDQRVSWPDAGQLDSEQSVDLYRQIVLYHREYRPHQTFNAAILRNLDEPEATGSFIAPDGQTFTITEDAYPRSQLPSLRRGRFAFKSTNPDAVSEALGLVRPPLLNPSTRGLSPARLNRILRAIRAESPLPPVCVIREAGYPIATLLDGAHRYFASIAAGLSFVPALHISLDDAVLGYRYESYTR